VEGAGAVEEFKFAVLDDAGEVLVDVFEASAEAHFHAEAEPSLELPETLRQNEALQSGFGGAVKGMSESVVWEPRGKSLGVLAEGQAAYVVESEAKQEVLEVHRFVLSLSRGKDGAEPVLYGTVDPTRHGLAQGARGEFERRCFTLEEPGVAVGVEDTLTEQIMEGGLPGGTLGIVVEAELEDVLEVLGVAGDSDETLFACEEGEGGDAGLVGATGGA